MDRVTAGSYASWYGRLRAKERRLIIAFIMAIAGSAYFSLFFRPALNEISRIKKEKIGIEERLKLLTSQAPTLDKTKQELEGIKQNIAKIKLKIKDVESKLVSPSQVPQLLTELIKGTQGLTIDFQSLKQKIETDKEGFLRLFIDLKFDSNYEGAVNYINKIENISPFIKIEETDITQSKSDPRNLITASLGLSVILASGAAKQGELPLSASPIKGEKLKVGRSPLTPRFLSSQNKNKELRLTGITYRGKGRISSAIINDTVVKVGDEIEGQKVADILFDSVIINDGIEDRALKIEQ